MRCKPQRNKTQKTQSHTAQCRRLAGRRPAGRRCEDARDSENKRRRDGAAFDFPDLARPHRAKRGPVSRRKSQLVILCLLWFL